MKIHGFPKVNLKKQPMNQNLFLSVVLIDWILVAVFIDKFHCDE